MKIWTDKKGKVHSRGNGDIAKQISEISEIMRYLYYRQTEMSDLCETIAESAATIPELDRIRGEARMARKAGKEKKSA